MKKIKYYINEKGCHICTSHASTGSGYPTFKREGEQHSIHRYLYEQKYGYLPSGVVLRHSCDNPLCINVDHLTPGNHQDNVNDQVERQRS
jgi:hypothetical protein